jgi:hypothetical protein
MTLKTVLFHMCVSSLALAQTELQIDTLRTQLQSTQDKAASSLQILDSPFRPLNWKDLVNANVMEVQSLAGQTRTLLSQVTTRLTPVPAGTSLQAALDLAQPGDTLVLEAGAIFKGNFMLPMKATNETITITSSAAMNLPVGKRVGPADAPNMAKVFSPNVLAAIATAPGAHNWRIIGIEVAAPGYYSGGVIRLGSGAETALADLPHDITIERVYVHGDPKLGSKRGIAPNGSHIAILDSYINDHKSDFQDAQAISCWNCDTIRVENNYLEASGENMFIAELGTIKDYRPFNITIARNYLRKPLGWKDGTDPETPGKIWPVKNLLELKAGIGVVISGNVLENCWISAQGGIAINLKPGAAAPVNASRTEDVLIENNLISGAVIGIQYSGTDTQNPSVGVGTMKNVTVRNNAFVHVGDALWGTAARLLQFSMSPTANLTMENNTIVGGSVNAAFSHDGVASPGFVFRNNLMTRGTYGIKGPGLGEGTATTSVVFPGGLFEGNVFLSPVDMSGKYPAGFRFVPDVTFGQDGYSQTAVSAGVDVSKLNAAITGVR